MQLTEETITINHFQVGEISVDLNVKRWIESHPYGNTVVDQPMIEWEIVALKVVATGEEITGVSMDNDMYDWLEDEIGDAL